LRVFSSAERQRFVGLSLLQSMKLDQDDELVLMNPSDDRQWKRQIAL
jgi:hypothetical protein